MTRDQIAVLLDRVDGLPSEAQDEILQSIVQIAQRHEGVYCLDPDERADIEAGLAEIERGDPPATDEAVEALFRKYGA
jgi:hypothetical protein